MTEENESPKENEGDEKIEKPIDLPADVSYKDIKNILNSINYHHGSCTSVDKPKISEAILLHQRYVDQSNSTIDAFFNLIQKNQRIIYNLKQAGKNITRKKVIITLIIFLPILYVLYGWWL